MNITVISASAGSGKTYNLAEQMLTAIQSGAARPDAIVAITYTNKAAAELASRLRQRLLRAGEPGAAARIRDGYLGTVHSVCQRLLGELAFEAGTSPYPEPVPGGYATELFQHAVGEVTHQQLTEIGALLDVLHLHANANKTRKTHSDWRDHLRKMVNQARQNRMDGQVLADSATRTVAELADLLGAPIGQADQRDGALWAALDPLQAFIDVELEKQAKKGKPNKALNQRAAWLAAVRQTLEQGRLPSWYQLTDSVKHFGKWKAAAAASADWFHAFGRHTSHPRFQADLTRIVHALMGLAQATGQRFTEAKQGERLLEFDDMLAQAADLLRLPAARERLRGRVDLLMVDEFQDTSPVQLEVIMALAGMAQRTVWVGDRKQGIFGFQGSDPQLMLRATEAVLDGAPPKVLPESFRSRPPLVGFCSDLFAAALAQDGFEEAEVRLSPACPEPAVLKDQPALHLWSITKDPAEPKAKVTETAGVARQIQALLAGDALQVRGEVDNPRDEAPTRALRRRDIAVLARTNSACRGIAAALEAAGIPARVAQDGLGQTPEALLVRAGLALVADRRDHMAAAEILWMLGEVDDPGAWLADRIRAANPPQGERAGLAFADSLPLKRLRQAAEAAATWSPEEAVVAVIAALDLHTRALSWPDPDAHLANLEAIRAVAQAYAATCGARRSAATVAGLVHHLETLDEKTEQALPTTEDAVRVVTYHKAKGLEWPVVVCTTLDTVYGADPFEPHVVAAPDFDVAAPLSGRELRWWPWPYGGKKSGLSLRDDAAAADITQQRQAQSMAEHRRMLYVAFTRARDHLILSRPGKQPRWLDLLTDSEGTPLLDLPWDADDGPATLTVGEQAYPCTVSAVVGTAPTRATAGHRRPQWFRTVDTPTPRGPQRISPSQALLSDGDAAAVQIDQVVRLGDRLPLRTTKAGQMEYIGNAIHNFLAADLGPTDPDRAALAQRLIANEGVAGVLDAPTVLEIADRFRAWLDGHAPGPRLPEWPVRWLREDGRAMSGDIDLLIPGEDGWTIVDHKSFPGDTAARDVRLRKWAGQLQAYRAAVKAATGQPVTNLWIHLPIRGEVVKLAVPR